MMTKTRKNAYTVGYARPPAEHRFQPGQSGNPRGRPPKARNFNSVVVEVLDRSTGSGRNRKTAFEAMVTALVDKAIAGHVPSLVRVLEDMQKHDTLEEPTPPAKDDEIINLDQRALEGIEFPDF